MFCVQKMCRYVIADMLKHVFKCIFLSVFVTFYFFCVFFALFILFFFVIFVAFLIYFGVHRRVGMLWLTCLGLLIVLGASDGLG